MAKRNEELWRKAERIAEFRKRRGKNVEYVSVIYLRLSQGARNTEQQVQADPPKSLDVAGDA
jgi:hypothetical protein